MFRMFRRKWNLESRVPVGFVTFPYARTPLGKLWSIFFHTHWLNRCTYWVLLLVTSLPQKLMFDYCGNSSAKLIMNRIATWSTKRASRKATKKVEAFVRWCYLITQLCLTEVHISWRCIMRHERKEGKRSFSFLNPQTQDVLATI